MKQIELKTTKLNTQKFTGEDKDIDFSYKNTLIDSIRTSTPPGGFTFNDIEIRLKIVEKLEKATTHLLIDEKQHRYLVEVLKSEKWLFMDKVIFDFIKDIENAIEVE